MSVKGGFQQYEINGCSKLYLVWPGFINSLRLFHTVQYVRLIELQGHRVTP